MPNLKLNFFPLLSHPHFYFFIVVTILTLIQIPIAALVCDVLQDFEYQNLLRMSILQYLFFSAFSIAPIALAWYLLLRIINNSQSTLMILVKKSVMILMLVASYSLAIVGFLDLHSDAQAAIVFVIFPIYLSLGVWLVSVIINYMSGITHK